MSNVVFVQSVHEHLHRCLSFFVLSIALKICIRERYARFALGKVGYFFPGYHLGNLSDPSPDSNLSMIDYMNFKARQQQREVQGWEKFKHYCMLYIDWGFVISEREAEEIQPVNLIAQLVKHQGVWVKTLARSLVSIFPKAIHIVRRSSQTNKQ